MSLPDWVDANWISTFTSIAAALGAALWGLYNYKRDKKQEMLTDIIIPVLEDYNELEDANLAIGILDDVDYEFMRMDDENAFNLYKGVIRKKDLPLLLRDHKWVDTSPEEEKVRESFDSLLYFFAELEYIVKLDLIKKDKLDLFEYEIKKAANELAVANFIQIYELPFHGKINDKLKLEYNENNETFSLDVVGNANDVKEYRDRLLAAKYKETRPLKTKS